LRKILKTEGLGGLIRAVLKKIERVIAPSPEERWLNDELFRAQIQSTPSIASTAEAAKVC